MTHLRLRLASLAFVLLSSVWAAGCAGQARHIAVSADYAFASAVFGADDIAFQGCQAKTIPDVTCAHLKTVMPDLLNGVKATSLTLRNMPKDASLPRALPDILRYLQNIDETLEPLIALSNPTVSRLAEQIHKALDETIKVLYAFTGVIQ